MHPSRPLHLTPTKLMITAITLPQPTALYYLLIKSSCPIAHDINRQSKPPSQPPVVLHHELQFRPEHLRPNSPLLTLFALQNNCYTPVFRNIGAFHHQTKHLPHWVCVVSQDSQSAAVDWDDLAVVLRVPGAILGSGAWV